MPRDRPELYITLDAVYMADAFAWKLRRRVVDRAFARAASADLSLVTADDIRAVVPAVVRELAAEWGVNSDQPVSRED